MTPRISFRDFAYTETPTGTQVVIITDIPCHLFIRWTILEPWIHSKPVLRRGMWLNDDVRFCFDVFSDCEQNEPGDTIIHTFTCGLANLDSDYWWYPWGYVEGDVSPSTGPIFKIHTPPVWPAPPVYIRSFWWRQFTNLGVKTPYVAGTGLAQPFGTRDIATRNDRLFLFTANNDDCQVKVYISEVDAGNYPIGDPLVTQVINLEDGVLDRGDPPLYPVYLHTIPLPLDLTPYHRYAFCFVTLTTSATWWRQFRNLGWEGEKDEGGSDWYSTKRTIDGGITWSYSPPGVTCFEAFYIP